MKYIHIEFICRLKGQRNPTNQKGCREFIAADLMLSRVHPNSADQNSTGAADIQWFR